MGQPPLVRSHHSADGYGNDVVVDIVDEMVVVVVLAMIRYCNNDCGRYCMNAHMYRGDVVNSHHNWIP